ncbi:MAG: prephenate dehydrogenase/arogenate dehydrogenase family protein [Bacillota bacterium]|nr:prephenate dehydrogenase/arogenate dehydrogenase family protein [Bacillota bacterium]
MRLAILGLGLVGGSVARALCAGSGSGEEVRIIGCDRDGASLEAAIADGVIDQALVIDAAHPDSNDWSALAGSDLILICLPTPLIPPVARSLAAALPGALLMDAASVKRPVLDAVCGLRFIGSHPMAGSERQGYAVSTPRLFEDAVWCLVPPAVDDAAYPGDAAADLALAAGLVTRLGARPLVLDAAAHDAAVAAISHLPHVVAAALVNAAIGGADEQTAGLAAGGFRDITRIAASDGALWRGICLENRGPLLESLTRFETEMARFRAALEADDPAALEALFAAAAQSRAGIPASGHGALPIDASLSLDILDCPGSLARITTLLGDAGISIRNLAILHARQYEGGRLRVYLGERGQLGLAQAILERAGYQVGP